MGIQAFGPEFPIEAFDLTVVGWFGWPGKVEGDALLVSPQIEVARDEFTSVINTDRGRIADLPTHALKRLDNVFALVAQTCINGWREAREGINRGKNPADRVKSPGLADLCQAQALTPIRRLIAGHPAPQYRQRVGFAPNHHSVGP